MRRTPSGAGHVSARVLEREQLHRRSVIAAVAALVVFSTSPVFGHHLAEPLTAWLVGRDHLLNLCLIALHEILAPVHEGFHLLVAGGVLYAVADRLRAVWRLRRALGELPRTAADAEGAIGRAASSVGVSHGVIRVVRGCRVPAFTAGLWRPYIFVSDALAAKLAVDELAAVIAHEDAHRRRRDPLRLTVWRFLACMLFFLPALRRLADDIADEAEVAADDDAVTRAQVQPLSLASALVTIAQRFGAQNSAMLGTATAFHRAEILGRRVRRLAGEDAPIGTHLTRRSAIGAALALSAVWVSGLIVAHPLPAYGHAVVAQAAHAGAHHCRHEHAWAISHLFCRGFGGHATVGSAQHCPHDG